MIDKRLQRSQKAAMSGDERVRDFQRKLYHKAKRDKEFRFYVLYDKISLLYFLETAYKRVKANKGAPGADGATFADIERDGVREYLLDIKKELEDRIYCPQPVLRVYVPKANGKMRPLGIPTIRDRIVQMSCKMVIEPIFEADFEDASYGFRPKRSAHDAVTKIRQSLKTGRQSVFDADLSSYFDTIPHSKLLDLVAKRISDKNVIHLIKMWLKAPVIEDGKTGGGKKNKVGTPQGGVISPLLANIYLDLVDKLVRNSGQIFARCGIRIIRYADDFILMGKEIPANALRLLEQQLELMDLSLNMEKSRKVNAQVEPFDFLGFTFRLDKSFSPGGGRYWNVIPSKKSLKKFRDKLKVHLHRRRHHSPVRVVHSLNPIIRGWMNYFTIDGVSYMKKPAKELTFHLNYKIRKFYKRKSQRPSRRYGGNVYRMLVEKYGLKCPYSYLTTATAKA